MTTDKPHYSERLAGALLRKLDEALQAGWSIKLSKSPVSNRVICKLRVRTEGGIRFGTRVSGVDVCDALAQALQIVECDRELGFERKGGFLAQSELDE